MAGSLRKRIIGGLIGGAFAAIYGFFTILTTGGGHGNLVWFLMFVIAEFFGLYFVVMGALAADLKTFFQKVLFASLLAYGFLVSILMIGMWIGGGNSDWTNDFSKVWTSNYGLVLFTGVVHFFPLMIFTFILVRSILVGEPNDESENINSLGLE